jgi:CHAT domain-containing protein
MDLQLQLAGKDGMPAPTPVDSSHVCTWSLPVCRLVTLASNVQVHKTQFSAKIRLQHVGSAGPHLGWLIAGASAVVSSAWYVDHECKTVFFAKMYERMTMDGLDIAQALHSTQRWLRSATQLDYVSGWPKEWQSISWTDRLDTLKREELAVRASGKEPTRPFASPFFWAGFSVWGDGNASGKHAETKAKKDGGNVLLHAFRVRSRNFAWENAP